jgi:isopentenyl-diphosphate delta-isomerase
MVDTDMPDQHDMWCLHINPSIAFLAVPYGFMRYDSEMSKSEQIVFVNEDGTPTGEVGPKLESHTANTKRHLAFSCYIFRRSDNMFLATQRALSKKVWPGVWTNSVCGHPAPGESIKDAIHRRAAYEIGLTDLRDIRCVLPKYTYTTPPYNGIIENEFCPVFIAYVDDEPKPNPEEVEAYEWLDWSDYAARLHDDPEAMSYWAKDQYKQLKALEPFVSLAS